MTHPRLDYDFYRRDVLEVCPGLIGKVLVRAFPDGTQFRSRITEVEAYRGEEDLACHAARGRTNRTEVMYREGGLVYIYLIYGMYWMLNIVASVKDQPQAALVRGLEEVSGPGRLTKKLEIDRSFYGLDLVRSDKLWIENHSLKTLYTATQRIGIDYAGEWKDKPWRFVISL